jgi:histidine triad (HIT) family protein
MATSLPCVFDPIIAGEAPAHLVLDEPDVVAFLDIRPVFAGHTLVVPRAHIETAAELPSGLAGRLWEAGARIAAAQRAALEADGTFFGLNDVISQSVPHLHLHVVPRRRQDGLRGFFWPRNKYGPGEAGATAAAIRNALAAPAPAGDAGTGNVQVGGETTAAEATGGSREIAASQPASAPGAVTVRTARPDDAEAVAALLAGGALTVSEDTGDLDGYRRALAQGDDLVAEREGRVIGTCQLMVLRHIQHNGGLCAEIESMHVAADQRGFGVGSVLLRAAVERARAAGCYRIQLTSNKARADAHRFYLRHGFEATHEGFKLYL